MDKAKTSSYKLILPTKVFEDIKRQAKDKRMTFKEYILSHYIKP
jgi:hypothetical protein